MTQEDKERKAFEVWHNKEYLVKIYRTDNGYNSSLARDQWEAWQAAKTYSIKEQERHEIPDGTDPATAAVTLVIQEYTDGEYGLNLTMLAIEAYEAYRADISPVLTEADAVGVIADIYADAIMKGQNVSPRKLVKALAAAGVRFK